MVSSQFSRREFSPPFLCDSAISLLVTLCFISRDLFWFQGATYLDIHLFGAKNCYPNGSAEDIFCRSCEMYQVEDESYPSLACIVSDETLLNAGSPRFYFMLSHPRLWFWERTCCLQFITRCSCGYERWPGTASCCFEHYYWRKTDGSSHTYLRSVHLTSFSLPPSLTNQAEFLYHQPPHLPWQLKKPNRVWLRETELKSRASWYFRTTDLAALSYVFFSLVLSSQTKVLSSPSGYTGRFSSVELNSQGEDECQKNKVSLVSAFAFRWTPCWDFWR